MQDSAPPGFRAAIIPQAFHFRLATTKRHHATNANRDEPTSSDMSVICSWLAYKWFFSVAPHGEQILLAEHNPVITLVYQIATV